MPIPIGVLAQAGAGLAVAVPAAYWGGGQNNDPTKQTTVDKMLFSNDTSSSLSSGLPTAINNLAAMANSGTAGYFGGGNTTTTVSAVEKYIFAGDTRSTLSTGLSVNREQLAAMANSGTAGYFGGGVGLSSIDKFAFSNDSRTTLTATLGGNAWALAAMANSGTAGYFGGGVQGGGSANVLTRVDKITFSNDSRATLGTGLSAQRYFMGAMANSGTAGYFGGGIDTADSSVSTVDKFAFSNDARSTLGTGLNFEIRTLAGAANSGTAGYFGGGISTQFGVTTSSANKFAFSNDARSVVSNVLSAGRERLAGMANSSGTL